MSGFLSWCERSGLDPRQARRGDLDAFVGSGAPRAAATRARQLSALSSWFDYLVSNGVTTVNPVNAVDRPEVDRDASPTVGLSNTQVGAFMRSARAATGRTARRDTALLGFMAELGLRVGEVIALDVEHLRHNRGHRTVQVPGKGGKMRELPIPAPLGRDLDAYLDQRQGDGGDQADAVAVPLTGPLFVTSSGGRMAQPNVFTLVRRTAKAAGLPNADRLSPHGLRHTLATAALDAGAPLRDVQDLLGHADPRTTRRYDRSRGSLDRSPAYLVAGLFAHDEPVGDA
ncbi:tyrosine-type recombinase/integrase [Dactylosporangium sp. NPDC006015]|uniref:tyrosine-type recombinase/integrase n=1 Tax=Dactylosporangium sp. NPDC006015 TaxID=3154576 RepID=UPI00339DE6CC